MSQVQLIDLFLLVGLAYMAIICLLVFGYIRLKRSPYTVSSRSSQFFEDKWLKYGIAPWHIGIIVVLIGHLIPFILPGVWAEILSNKNILLFIETCGIAFSTMALIGLIILLARRVTSSYLQSIATRADIIVMILLLLQILLGLHCATSYKYGSIWSTGTVVPYIWSIIKLNPDISLVSGFPMVFKIHIAGGFIILMLLPFTQLIHLLSLPIKYLWRSPQIVVWSSARNKTYEATAIVASESRREFMKGFAGAAGAGALLGVGVLEKTLNYFKGPTKTIEEETSYLQKRLQRLQQTAEDKELELERLKKDMIFIVQYSQLSDVKGKYFIDYDMSPGLAFVGKDGVPIVISAKCTHLGCTVGSDVDQQGRILCPCHISYFDIKTGRPHEGSPAKLPLRQISWALLDGSGKIIASKLPDQPVKGDVNPELFKQCSLYIVKPGKVLS